MKYIIIKNIPRYKYERIQIIGPARCGLFNCYVENDHTSTCLRFGNSIITSAKKPANLDAENQMSVYELLDSSEGRRRPTNPVYRSRFHQSVKSHSCTGLCMNSK